MSFVQSSVASEQRGPFGAEPTRSRPDLGPVLGLGLVGLGLGMLCLGIFHGFAHGSCSSTGYSRNYGPVPHCSSGTGWWMLMLMVGLVVAGGGAILASSVGSLMLPMLFVAIGAPFIALAFGDHGRLLMNASSGTGKIYSGVFGGGFVIAGLIWGAFAARGVTGVSGGSLLGGVLAAVVGVGAAFAIASGVSTAIGKTTAPSSVQGTQGVTVSSASAERAREISLCKELVAAQHLIGAHAKASLAAKCTTNWRAAERQLPKVAKRAAVAYATTRCRQQTQQVGASSGLPASAGTTLARAFAGACGNPVASSQGKGLKGLEATLCRQIVEAQVPAAARKQALASCARS